MERKETKQTLSYMSRCSVPSFGVWLVVAGEADVGVAFRSELRSHSECGTPVSVCHLIGHRSRAYLLKRLDDWTNNAAAFKAWDANERRQTI